MVSFEWFVSEHSGCLADQDTPQAHADVILTELKRWEHGERNAARISTIWQKRLHAHNVAAAMINLAP